MPHMKNFAIAAIVFAAALAAQAQKSDAPAPNDAPPRSEPAQKAPEPKAAEESSSRDTLIDLAPPINDARDHPNSQRIVDEVTELPSYNPMRAGKCVEIGNYYFDQQNYAAAESRYLEALMWKENDAEATWRLALVEDKLKKPAQARRRYDEYLQILPRGPHAKEAVKALERLAKLLVEPPVKP